VTASADAAVAAPAGTVLVLEVDADGVQIYACEAKDGAFAWVFKAPEAALFDATGREIGTHFAGPTWKLGDGSAVQGEIVARADAPEHGAIPWLLLRAKNASGSGTLGDIAFIRRIATQGGVAPAAGCDAAHAGTTARMRYSARYQFIAALTARAGA
jgi:Protein of unknown function (DUF3455)